MVVRVEAVVPEEVEVAIALGRRDDARPQIRLRDARFGVSHRLNVLPDERAAAHALQSRPARSDVQAAVVEDVCPEERVSVRCDSERVVGSGPMGRGGFQVQRAGTHGE